MKGLSINWITEGLIDFEYKKYVLLGYLKKVQERFISQRLYPTLSDLVLHYNNLISLEENKKNASEAFPKSISKLDFKQFRVEYDEMLKQDETLLEIEKIMKYAIPRLKQNLEDGKEIYDIIEDKLSIEPIGITPINKNDGYMFVRACNESETRAYQYQITIFESADEKHRGIKTSYVTSFNKSIANTYEGFKVELIKQNKSLPNPATYIIESELSVPYKETLIPIAKRSLVRYISNIS